VRPRVLAYFSLQGATFNKGHRKERKLEGLKPAREQTQTKVREADPSYRKLR